MERYSLADVIERTAHPRPLYHIEPAYMANHQFGIIVWPFLFGQHRIQLIDMTRPIEDNVARELCTFDPALARITVMDLSLSYDPIGHCNALTEAWNCDGPGAPIRLDSRPDPDPDLEEDDAA